MANIKVLLTKKHSRVTFTDPICSGEPSMLDFPSEPNKTFLHISLCHLMKAIRYKIGHCFKKEKQFIKSCISLLAYAGNLKDVFDICKCLFEILLSKKSITCEMSKRLLNGKAENFERFKRDSQIICEKFVPKDNIAMQDKCKLL